MLWYYWFLLQYSFCWNATEKRKLEVLFGHHCLGAQTSTSVSQMYWMCHCCFRVSCVKFRGWKGGPWSPELLGGPSLKGVISDPSSYHVLNVLQTFVNYWWKLWTFWFVRIFHLIKSSTCPWMKSKFFSYLFLVF